MPTLNDRGRPVALGNGYEIRTPGVVGTAELIIPRTAGERARSRAGNDGTIALDAALAACDVSEVRQVDLTVQRVYSANDDATGNAGDGESPAWSRSAMRSIDGRDDVIELTAPDLGPDYGQLVLSCDEHGVLTWHFPVSEAADGSKDVPPAAGTRGGGPVKRFLIPAAPTGNGIDPATMPQSPSRSVLGAVGRRLLKVLVYPVTDPVIGAASALFSARWEASKRPYGLRDFSPANFREPSQRPLDTADWARIAGGRALLFVHGTFSTAHSAFAGIPDATFAELHARYEGRVFAFDHHSLSHDPVRNAEWFAAQVADALPNDAIDIDIIGHSRGGLVAREIARLAADELTSHVRVRKIVFVGVPNAGTPLASPDHMTTMIDRLTTALNLFPTGVVTETLEAIITAVKVIGHGAVGGLAGLDAMNPSAVSLAALNRADMRGDQYYAIAADYAPVNIGLRALIRGTAIDAVADRVFEQVANDLVVPEPGVFVVDGSAAFPIPAERSLRVPASAGVIHTTLFAYPHTSDRLLEWMTVE